mgnify:CR=1 FL=1
MSHSRTTKHNAKTARQSRQGAQRRPAQQRRDAERLRDRYEAESLFTSHNLPKITHVAIEYAGRVWSLPAPNRHHNVIRMIAKETGDGIRGPDTQGFLDETGRFLGRVGAFQLASDNGQLQRKPGGYGGRELFSEGLW